MLLFTGKICKSPPTFSTVHSQPPHSHQRQRTYLVLIGIAILLFVGSIDINPAYTNAHLPSIASLSFTLREDFKLSFGYSLVVFGCID